MKPWVSSIHRTWNLGRVWSGRSDLVSWGCSQDVSWQDAVIWKLDRAGESASRMMHSHGWQAKGRCWQIDSVPIQVGLSTGCLSVLRTWHMASPRTWNLGRAIQEEELSSCPFMTQLQVTLHYFCQILLIRSKSPSPAHIQRGGIGLHSLKGGLLL